MALADGLSLGLATGVSCLASCGPVYAAYLFSEQRSVKQSFQVILALILGRFSSYALFGALVGQIGGSVPPGIRIPVTYSGYILFSVFLILSIVRVNRKCGGCQVSRWVKFTGSPFLLGILTGFSICPAFLIALTRAFDVAGPLAGALLFIGFFFGTTVYILPFSFFGLFTKKKWFTTVARIMAIFVSVYFLVTGIRGLAGHYLAAPDPRLVEAVPREDVFFAMEEDTLYLLTFPQIAPDRGVELADDLLHPDMPPLVVVTADTTGWLTAVSRIPELSVVIGPWWLDGRSGAELSSWQQSVTEAAEERRFRVFAVAYEPYDRERAGIVYQYLSGFGYRCDPDSGFSFLVRADLECVSSDCSTCPALGNY